MCSSLDRESGRSRRRGIIESWSCTGTGRSPRVTFQNNACVFLVWIRSFGLRPGNDGGVVDVLKAIRIWAIRGFHHFRRLSRCWCYLRVCVCAGERRSECVMQGMWKAFIHLFFRVNYLEIVDSNRRPDCIVLFYLEGSSLYVLWAQNEEKNIMRAAFCEIRRLQYRRICFAPILSGQ